MAGDQWWEGSSCALGPVLDERWNGTLGIGIGENGVVDEDEIHRYSHLTFNNGLVP